jgi:hypothetical protein
VDNVVHKGATVTAFDPLRSRATDAVAYPADLPLVGSTGDINNQKGRQLTHIESFGVGVNVGRVTALLM